MSYINLYNYSITGDCSNTSSGELYFEVSGDSPNWVVSEISGSGLLPTTILTPGSNSYYVNGLPYGNYVFQVVESTIPPIVPTIRTRSFWISTGTTISLIGQDTTCNLPNGSITAYTEFNYGQSTFELYDISSTFITSGQTSFGETYFVFNNLSDGNYYVTGDDGGGCQGISESTILRPSLGFNFGYYKVDDASCVFGQGSGKIYITGLTSPISAYTINWLSNVNGQTGTTITGLTQALYTVEITNQLGCVQTESIQIDNIPQIGLGALYVTQPDCFQSNGEVTVLVTGGTAPFYYSGSNGTSVVTFDTSYTFTGLNASLFNIVVTDAGLCNFTTQTTLVTPGSFGTVNISTTNSNCNSNNGAITVAINNGVGSGNYIYTLSGNSGQSIVTIPGGQTQPFNGVSSGDYVITIDNNTGCIYTGTTTIINEDKFTITGFSIATTCNLNNGSLNVGVSSGATFPVSYNLFGPTSSPQNITQNSGVFSNLQPGNYTLTATDATGCQQTFTTYIPPSNQMYFDLIASNPVFGNDGQISVVITSGEPPFTYNWSLNVGSQTGLLVTGLTSGIYTLQITDSNGCSFDRTVKLLGTELLGEYNYVTICKSNFENSNIMGKRGIKQMFNEGYFDLISGDTNCVLNNANFTLKVKVGNEEVESNFYSSAGLDDYPTDLMWGETLTTLLNSFVGIGEVLINYENNTIKITNDCEEINKNCGKENYNLLNDTRIIVNLAISYNISCVLCETL
jgi:hypothetical protein